ncbi:ABC transporter ATP-binding protein [soil metagenome]
MTDCGGAPLIEAVGITKRFGARVANEDISLTVLAGEVHALLGENGAGKSTFTRILYGLSQPDEGELRVDGSPTRLSSPKDAMVAGVGMVTQEFSLVGPMTVTENVMLAGVGFGPVDRGTARAQVQQAAERLGVTVHPDARVEDLSVGERQRVEIIKALHHGCRVLILDEPTAVLVPQDVRALFETIGRLRAEGLGVVFISHKLHEVVEIADRVTVLRRGRRVITRPASGLDRAEIATLMIGRDGRATTSARGATSSVVDPVEAVDTRAALEVSGLTLTVDGGRVLDEVNLSVAPGEVVGVAGVSGNGQTQLVSVLCGMTPPTTGAVCVGGVDITRAGPVERLRAGLGRITEDRRGSVVPNLSVEQNLVLEDLDRFRRWGFTDRGAVREHTRRLMADFDIRAEADAPIGSLSGGNMQKVLLARALSRRPTALVASQPTRGLDVGACGYVHDQLRAVRERGGGVLLISEDLDELLGLADRLVVLFSGRIIGEMTAGDATPEALGLLMTGAGVAS